MTRYRKSSIGLTAVLAVLVAAAVAVALHGNSGSRVGSTDTSPQATTGAFRTASSIPGALARRPIPQFDLTDARGGRFSSRTLRGRAYALTFLYVHCVDICPLIGAEIQQALTKLGTAANHMTVVAISVDPRGDTRAAVNHWLNLHHEPPNFHYLIGPQHALAPIWKAFYVSPQKSGDPQSSHTAIIWLVNRHAHLAALIPAGLAISTTNLAHDFSVLQRQ